MKSVLYYCDISDPTRLLKELTDDGIEIVSKRDVAFTDGTTQVQLTVKLTDGAVGHLVPASLAAQQRQRDAGRSLAPYSWVSVSRATK